MEFSSSNSSTGSSKENNKPEIDEPKISIQERMKLLTSSFENNSKEVSPPTPTGKVRLQRRNLIRFQTQV
jgi:hypothetical protein